MKKAHIPGVDGSVGHPPSGRILATTNRPVGDRGQVAAARALVD